MPAMRASRVASGAALLACVAVAALGKPAVVPLTLPSGKLLQVEVMVRDADRAMGLMFRPSLPGDRGMLFVFEQLGHHGIWMKNCRFPIDIVWLDEKHRVVHVHEAAPPCTREPCPTYRPIQSAQYVLEIGAGQARREGVEVGSRLDFEYPPGPN